MTKLNAFDNKIMKTKRRRRSSICERLLWTFMKNLVVLSSLHLIGVSANLSNNGTIGGSMEERAQNGLTECKKYELQAIMLKRKKVCKHTIQAKKLRKMNDACREACPNGIGYCESKTHARTKKIFFLESADCMCFFQEEYLQLEQAWQAWISESKFANEEYGKENPCANRRKGTDCSEHCPRHCHGKCGHPGVGICYCYDSGNGDSEKKHTWLPVSVTFGMAKCGAPHALLAHHGVQLC